MVPNFTVSLSLYPVFPSALTQRVIILLRRQQSSKATCILPCSMTIFGARFRFVLCMRVMLDRVMSKSYSARSEVLIRCFYRHTTSNCKEGQSKLYHRCERK